MGKRLNIKQRGGRIMTYNDINQVIQNQKKRTEELAGCKKDFQQIQIKKWADKSKDCPLKPLICGIQCKYDLCLMHHWQII